MMIRKNCVYAALTLSILLAMLPQRFLAAEPAPVTIRVGATGNDTAAEVYYADELGLFKKRGLDVQIQNLRNGAAQAAAVVGGALDVGEQNVVSMANARLRGVPFKFIAPAGEYISSASTTSLVVGKSSLIASGRDLEGKTVAVNALNDLTQVGASAWIEKNGGDVAKVHFIEMPAGEIGAAIARGTIGAGVVPEPSLTMVLGEVRVLAQPYDAIAGHFMINGWFASEEWIKKNPVLAKRFAEAVYEAGHWANSHRMESAKILARHSKATTEVIARMRRATYGDHFDPASLQTVLDVALHYKSLKAPVAALELINATF